MYVTYIGGPTALLELDGYRLLTDPTFDPAGTVYPAKGYALEKRSTPALTVPQLGGVDAVLLSHDHHADNLDNTGREVVRDAGVVLTTVEGAQRLGGRSVGLAPWSSYTLATVGHAPLEIIGTPARHGPEGGDRGPVTGFVFTRGDDDTNAVYISGDTVWFDGVADVARRFTVRYAILFLGAAKVSVAGPKPLTFTAAEAVQVARAMPAATIIPLHYEGWAHFTESRAEVQETFTAAGLNDRLQWLTPGERTPL